MSVKIGFVYFDSPHIVPHFIGTVAELVHHFPDVDVKILVPEIKHDYLEKKMKELDIPSSVMKPLSTYWWKKIAYSIQGRTKPSNRFIFYKHKDYLRSFDLLAFNVFNHMHIKEIKNDGVKFVFLMHGAGDRHYPFAPEYKPFIEQFDLVTTAGPKINRMFKAMGAFPHTEFKICGYPKLDVVSAKREKFFENNNPVVVYNPHFERNFSSFEDWGLKVLEFFAAHKQYNLIFAPHINLFNPEKRLALSRDTIPARFFDKKNILIDFGSEKSVDMTYLKSSDIYLGDMSSQIYEFLLTGIEKPSIFLNSKRVSWEGNPFFNHWQLGKVIDDFEQLGSVLEKAEKWVGDYKEIRKQMLDDTFDVNPGKKATRRVAETLYELARSR